MFLTATFLSANMSLDMTLIHKKYESNGSFTILWLFYDVKIEIKSNQI